MKVINVLILICLIYFSHSSANTDISTKSFVKLREEVKKNSQDINQTQTTISEWKKHIDIEKVKLFNEYINIGSIGLLGFFLVILGGLFGIEVFRLNYQRKKYEKKLNDLNSAYQEKYIEYKENTKTLFESHETKIASFERKLQAYENESNTIIVQYMRDLEIQIDEKVQRACTDICQENPLRSSNDTQGDF